MAIDPKVLERLQKLSALANDAGAAQGEIENATRMLQAMLDRHNLSMADIETKPATPEDVEEIRVNSINERRFFSWEFDLAVAIARGFNCEALRNGSGYYRFFGLPHNVKIATEVFEIVRGKADTLATQTVKDYSLVMSIKGYSPRDLKGVHSLRTYRVSFLQGFAHGIYMALNTAKRANNAQVQGLVRVQNALVKSALETRLGKIGTFKGNSNPTNNGAWAQGFEKGKATEVVVRPKLGEGK